VSDDCRNFIRRNRSSLLVSNGHDESIDGTFINQRGLISRSANSEKPFGTGCEKGVRVCLRVVRIGGCNGAEAKERTSVQAEGNRGKRRERERRRQTIRALLAAYCNASRSW